MCPAGSQGAVRFRQVRQLMQTLAVVCRTLFSVTNTTNTQAELHFKATGRVIGELLRVVCLHLSATWQLFMRLHPVMNERPLTYFRSLKIYHVLIFGGIFLDTKYGRGVCLSIDTYMANRGWGPPMPTSPCNDREGEGVIASPASIIL